MQIVLFCKNFEKGAFVFIRYIFAVCLELLRTDRFLFLTG